MKVKLEIIDKFKEETCTLRIHKITPFFSDIVTSLENNPDNYLVAQTMQENVQEKVPLTTILYFEYLDRKVFIYTSNNIFEIKKALYKLEQELPEYFIRISKNVIVNIRFLQKFIAKSNGNLEAVFPNKERVIVSRKYVAALKKALANVNPPLMY